MLEESDEQVSAGVVEQVSEIPERNQLNKQ